ncbi:hypothetical protein AB1L42_14740 [Thalassoglobus sp. JC818]|uniref:hypothetical protein n=1 Tax=Thalassoglobus sp. JC818 TaxID=3232136 RepID=UPI003459FA24
MRWLKFVLLGIGFVVVALFAATVISAVADSMFDKWQLVFLRKDSISETLLLSLGCGTAVALIAILHQYERQLISSWLGRTLLVLRLLLVLILFLTLLEPMWTWSYDDERSGRVLVALDVSESMDTHDSHASLREKLSWARSMGVFGNEEAQQRVDRWMDELESGNSPTWVTVEEEPDPVKREQLAKLRKADIDQTLENVTEYSRLELALRSLAGPQDSFLDQLSELVEAEVAMFAVDYNSTDRAALKKLIAAPKIEVPRNSSFLMEAMRAALASPDAETPLQGLVLFSDGRDTSDLSSDQLVQRIADLNVPVHTVVLGSEIRPRDLSVTHIEASETVFKDDTPTVKGILQSFGFDNEDVTVFIDWIDDPQRDPLQQIVNVNSQTTEVDFTLDELPVGRHRFRLRTSPAADELREDNNAREFAIDVIDDSAQVLLIDNSGRWEFRFLSTALERDKRVTLQKILFEQPFLGVLPKPFFLNDIEGVRTEDGVLKNPTTTRYSNFDCVIVGDVSPHHMPVEEWKQLEKYVREEGGTLVLTAGKKEFPNSYRGTIVDSLLPIERLRVIDLQGADQLQPPELRGFRLSITPDGQRLGMFQLGDDWNLSRQIWATLPGHSWGITGRAKGAATVMATAAIPGANRTLEDERDSGLIVQQHIGSGQVLWIGIDSTWRWRFRVGDEYHHRFWGQLIRWAINFKASGSNDLARISLTPSVISEGETTVFQARWVEQFVQQHPDVAAFAFIESPTDPDFLRRVPLRRQHSKPPIDEGTIGDLEPGEYRVSLDVPGFSDEQEKIETALIVNEVISQELADISTNQELLERLAAQTGGQFFHLHEVDRIPELFRNINKTVSIREEIPLWGHWSILLIFSIVATTEWVMRKLNGLP